MANSAPNQESGPSVLFLAMLGRFSAPPLAALIEAGMDVRGVVLPGRPDAGLRPRRTTARLLPVLREGQRDVVQIALERGIPVFEAGNLSTQRALEAVADLEPDVIAVACFPRRIPAAFRAAARFGALNVHPSLLPSNRGPEPLFWAFREGADETGVTVHLMTDALDAGPIVLQRRVPVAEGVRAEELEGMCAETGGELLVEAIRLMASGQARPVPQDEALASYQPAPDADDLLVPVDRAARWAYRFVRGIGGRYGPARIRCLGREFTIVSAEGYEADGELGEEAVLEGRVLRVQCRPGVLRVTVDDGVRPAGRTIWGWWTAEAGAGGRNPP